MNAGGRPRTVEPGAEARALFPFHADHPEQVYLDHACMTPKSQAVIDALNQYYRDSPVCAGRSTHRLGVEITRAVEENRRRLHGLVNAGADRTVVWTRNTTEAINVVARGFPIRGAVLTTDREHSSNLVPWQRWHRHEPLGSTPDEGFDLGALERRLARGDVGLVSVYHVSNLDGHETPLSEIVRLAHDHGVPVLADGAQALPHHPVDLDQLDVDLYAVSLHKAGAPTGVGALVARTELLEQTEPLILGGGTVTTTTPDGHQLETIPARFEAGLQDYGGLVATGPALDLLAAVGPKRIESHERTVGAQLQRGLDQIGARPLGARQTRGTGCTSFTFDGVDAHVLAALLDQENVLVRAGRHCLHSWFHTRGVDASVRASCWLTTTPDDIERFLGALERALPAARTASR